MPATSHTRVPRTPITGESEAATKPAIKKAAASTANKGQQGMQVRRRDSFDFVCDL